MRRTNKFQSSLEDVRLRNYIRCKYDTISLAFQSSLEDVRLRNVLYVLLALVVSTIVFQSSLEDVRLRNACTAKSTVEAFYVSILVRGCKVT